MTDNIYRAIIKTIKEHKPTRKGEINMKKYRVYIDDDYSMGDYMVCEAKNKTEARAAGRLYIRQWQLKHAKIVKIEEHTEE